MNMKLQILVLIGLNGHLASTFLCTGSAGISYTDCGPPSGGGGGSPRTTFNAITSCQDTTYTGGSPQGYEYTDFEEIPDIYQDLFLLTITSMSLPSDDTLLIKTFHCPDGCKIAMINSSVVIPLIIIMNKQDFVFFSKSSAASVAFNTGHHCFEECGGNMTADGGTIDYPESNGKYEIDCVWFVSTPGKALSLTLNFTKFYSEPDFNCAVQFLQIQDGFGPGSSTSPRYCSNTPPVGNEVIVTANSEIRLWFHSDGSAARLGFRVDWTTIY